MPRSPRLTVSLTMIAVAIGVSACGGPSPEDYLTMPKEEIKEIIEFCNGEAAGHLAKGRNPVEERSKKCENLNKGSELLRQAAVRKAEAEYKEAEAQAKSRLESATTFALEHQKKQKEHLDSQLAEANQRIRESQAMLDALTTGSYVLRLTEILKGAQAGQPEFAEISPIFVQGGGISAIKTKTPVDYNAKLQPALNFNVEFDIRGARISATGEVSRGVLAPRPTLQQLPNTLPSNTGGMTTTTNYEAAKAALSGAPVVSLDKESVVVAEIGPQYSLSGSSWAGTPMEFVVFSRTPWSANRPQAIGGFSHLQVFPRYDVKTNQLTWHHKVIQTFGAAYPDSHVTANFQYALPQ